VTAPFAALPFEPRSDLAEGLRREWGRLARPGAMWDGRQRVAIAATARGGDGAEIPAAAVEAARTLYDHPAAIDAGAVDAVRGAGLTDAAYVEIVGVVSRLAAADTLLAALGRAPEPLPEPVPGAPTGEVDLLARRTKGHVPMVGGASIVGALSMVPAEARAQRDLHGPLYLSYEQMDDLTLERGLDRTRMELVASRTSAVNECFY